MRKVSYTEKPPVTEQVNYIKPTASNPADGYDKILFDWDDVPNAEFYLFELAENTGFNLNPKIFLLNHSDTTLLNLKKGGKYYWRVTPYNTNSFCIVPKIIPFTSPTTPVANVDIENPDVACYVIQTEQDEMVFHLNSVKSQVINLEILNANGQLLNKQQLHLDSGTNIVSIQLSHPGLYLYRLISKEKGQNTGKFLKI